MFVIGRRLFRVTLATVVVETTANAKKFLLFVFFDKVFGHEAAVGFVTGN